MAETNTKSKQPTIKSFYQGPNNALIKGAGMVYGSQNQSISGIDFSSRISSLSQSIEAARNQAEQKRAAVQKEANEAYSALSNMDFTGVMPTMYDGVQAQLLPIAREIAQLKMEMSSISDPEEKALINSEINKKTALITGFTQQVKDLNKNALDQLDYNRSNDKSDANDDDYVSAINKVFSGQLPPLMVDGQLAFDINGKITKYSELENITPKAYDEFTSYSDAVGAATSAREPIQQAKIEEFQSKMYSQITPDNIVSLGMDNFGTGKRILGDQFETIQDWKAYVNENYTAAKELLTNRLTENYVNTYNNAAAEYKRKNPPGGSGSGKGLGKNGFWNVDAQRLFGAMSMSSGSANNVETGDNFLLPGNPAGTKYTVSWTPEAITFKAKEGGRLIDPMTGSQAASTTMPIDQFASLYGIEITPEQFPDFFPSNKYGETPLTQEQKEMQSVIDIIARDKAKKAKKATQPGQDLIFRNITPGANTPGILNNLGKK